MSTLNMILIIITIMFVINMYNRMSLCFPILIPFILNCIINIISCAYVEEGIYLVDICKTSYMTGGTLRLWILTSIFLITLFILYYLDINKLKNTVMQSVTLCSAKHWLWLISLYVFYLLLDIAVSGSVLTNPMITRFNYYSNYSSLPLISTLSSFRYAMGLINGLLFTATDSNKRRIKIHSIINVLLLIISWILVGNQFTGILYMMIYFMIPILIKSVHEKVKLFNVKRLIVAAMAVAIALIPKLSYFQNHGIYGLNSQKYSSAISLLLYRMFGLQSALWWEIDRQIWEKMSIDFGQIGIELWSIFDARQQKNAGIFYLMKRVMPASEYNRYVDGNGTLAAGHPGIEIATLGYIGASLILIIEAILFWTIVKMLYKAIVDARMLDCVIITTLLYECTKIFTVGGIFWVGNLIPKLCILYLIVSRGLGLRIRFKIT